jgi:hypothetical protein
MLCLTPLGQWPLPRWERIEVRVSLMARKAQRCTWVHHCRAGREKGNPPTVSPCWISTPCFPILGEEKERIWGTPQFPRQEFLLHLFFLIALSPALVDGKSQGAVGVERDIPDSPVGAGPCACPDCVIPAEAAIQGAGRGHAMRRYSNHTGQRVCARGILCDDFVSSRLRCETPP